MSTTFPTPSASERDVSRRSRTGERVKETRSASERDVSRRSRTGERAKETR